MTSKTLASWQKKMGYTYESAAQALGISRATYGRYLKDGAPLYIGLACSALTTRSSGESDLVKKIKLILTGIDKEESNDNEGWWETSTGAQFGKNKLEEVILAIKPTQQNT